MSLLPGWDDDGDLGPPQPSTNEPLNGHSGPDPAEQFLASVSVQVREWPQNASESPPGGTQGYARPTHAERTDAAPWPDSVDFWGDPKLPDWKPEYSPPAIAPYIQDQAERRGVDATMQAAFCLGACASLIQAGIFVSMEEDGGDGLTWREHPVLWVAGVGEPGDGKGPAMNAALYRAKQIESEMRKQDSGAWERYEDQLKVHDRRLQSYYTEKAKNDQAERPLGPDRPPRRRLFTDDATKEAVAKILTENPRSKVTIMKMELASWFGSFGAYSAVGAEKDRADWLEFFESNSRPIDRVREGASYFVDSWGGCILGGIQPSKLAKLASKMDDDGMMQRFQVIIAGRKQFVESRPQNANSINLWNRVQDNLAAMEPRRAAYGIVGVTLSLQVKTFLNEKRRWLGQAVEGCGMAALRSALSKWEGLFGRLMITAHCIADAAAGRTVPSAEIVLATAEQCWAWMLEILWPHAIQFYGGSVNTEEFESCRKFGEFILARQLTEVRPGYLAGKWTHYKRLTPRARRQLFDSMVQCGWLRGTEIDPMIKAPRAYLVNSKIFDGRFAALQQKAVEQAKRYRETMPASWTEPDA